MVRVIVAVVVVSVIQFAWGFTFYGPLGSLDYMATRVGDEAAVGETLNSALPHSGTYFLPVCPGMNASEEATKAHEQKAAAGPLVQIHYRKEGFPTTEMPILMAKGFGHTLLTCLLAAFILRMVLPALPLYRSRVLFVFALGLFAAFGIRISDSIWFHHHWAFVAGEMFFTAVAWLLTGVVMGAIIRPMSQGETATSTKSPALAA